MFIRCLDLADVPEEESMTELSSQNVVQIAYLIVPFDVYIAKTGYLKVPFDVYTVPRFSRCTRRIKYD